MAIMLAFVCACAAYPAHARAIILQAGQSAEKVETAASHLVTAEGQELSYQQALAAYHAGKFSAQLSKARSHQMHDWRHWIALRFRGDEQISNGSVRRTIGLGGIFVELPRVYLACDGMPAREILAGQAGDNKPLSARYFTYVRTQTFDIAPGQSCLALINVASSDNPNIGIFREGELGSNQVVAVLMKGGFTATLLIIGIIMALVSYLTDRPLGMLMGITYSITMMQNEASLFTTTFVPSALDARTGWEALTILATFMMIYTFLSGFQAELRLTSRSRRRMVAILLFIPIIIIAYRSNSTPDIIWAFYLALILFAVTVAMRFDIARPLRLTAGGILIISALTALFIEPYYLGRYLPDLAIEFVRDTIRLSAGAGMLLLLLVDVLQSRRARTELIEGRIAALEKQSESDRALLQAERKYARAREAAMRRKTQLAAASHDIRQPLAGLRAVVHGEENRLSPQLHSRLLNAIDYLENLTNTYSSRADSDQGKQNMEEGAYSLDLITRAVGEMFGGEAAAAGIALKIQCDPCQTQVPALALIRASSNLVANALRHANATTISLQVQCDKRCQIIISDDGRGMDADELANSQRTGHSSPSTGGEGLGLSIVRDLAQKHGFDFTIQSAIGEGTVAILELPER